MLRLFVFTLWVGLSVTGFALEHDGYEGTTRKMQSQEPKIALGTPIHQQRLVDLVSLKDGSIIRGTIIRQIPNQSVTILTRDGSQFVIKMDDILEITKVPAFQPAADHYERKSPALAAGLSCLLPGLGQFYNDDSKGVIYLGLYVANSVLFYTAIEDNIGDYDRDGDDNRAVISLIAMLCVWVGSMFDAAMSAEDINIQRAYLRNQKASLNLNPITEGNRVGATVSIRF